MTTNEYLASLKTLLEAETAKLRETEKRLEALRADHYRAGDTLHAAQGLLYESNAEVARLEQQISHVRDNRQRIEHQQPVGRGHHRGRYGLSRKPVRGVVFTLGSNDR